MHFEPPDGVWATYGGWRRTVVWEWEGTATTWCLEEPDGAKHFLKVGRSTRWPNALDERARMRWARAFLSVPQVLACDSADGIDWLLTVDLEGTDATQHPLRQDPTRLVPALAHGLAAFHAAGPVASCPFDFTVGSALAHVHARAEQRLIDADEDLHPEHQHFTIDAAVRELERLAPRDEDLVVCHGDYCLPNVMLDTAGNVTGYVDLGELGIADRWWDIAIASWSVTWNLGPGFEELFISAYGTAPDPRRIAFYRLLYDLTS